MPKVAAGEDGDLESLHDLDNAITEGKFFKSKHVNKPMHH